MEVALSDEFRNAFGENLDTMQIELTEPLDTVAIIDHIEDVADSDCQVDYDRDSTWCEIRTNGVSASMRIQDQQIVVKGPASLSSTELIECYWNLQNRFLATIDTPG